MHFRTRITNSAIELSFGEREPEPLKPVAGTPQDRPRRFYIYAHTKLDGTIFYIGKGNARRAWSEDRHPLWHRYVEKHLGGKYQVVILQDNLTTQEAEEIESEWIAQESDTLINWFNFGRKTDLNKNDALHKLRNANRALINQAKFAESRSLADAVPMYLEAISACRAYAEWDDESGLVGQLLREEREEEGLSGEHVAIDRLTMCLVKLDRLAEAQGHFRSYFETYRGDRALAVYERIAKRLAKATRRAERKSRKSDAVT